MIQIIDNLREQNKMNLTDFCAQTGISTRTYYNLLKGKTELSFNFVKKALSLFDISIYFGNLEPNLEFFSVKEDAK